MDLVSKNIQKLLGPKGWISPEDCLPWKRDWLNQYGQEPLGIARPKSTSEVSEVLRLCHTSRVSVVPQGGNTGLVGGGVLGTPGGIILSLERMNTISVPDLLSGTIVVESGVILGNLVQFLSSRQLIFPLRLGSEGSAQIGGLIATNAGGSHAFRHGMMQDLVLGLEVVLPNGVIWNGMRRVQKDNTGYQLRKLFCGSEGTLGVVTKAVLKLSPQPKQCCSALLALRNAEDLVTVATKLRADCGEFLAAIEFFSDIGLGIALKHIPDLDFPLKTRTPFYILAEVDSCSMQVPLDSIFSAILEWGVNKGIVADGAIAMSEAQRAVFWRLREEQPEGQRLRGAQIKHDISVPLGRLVDFLYQANEECNKLLKGVLINPFGHLGDGNIHYNLSPPEGQDDFLNLDSQISMKLSRLATVMDGSFAAEHGIGRAKILMADVLTDPIEISLMKSLKDAIDADHILNPGVLFVSSLPEN